MWSGDNFDNSDLDAHCIEPNGNTIYYSNDRSKTGGNLDVDVRRPLQERPKGAVENITFPNTKNILNGNYTFFSTSIFQQIILRDLKQKLNLMANNFNMNIINQFQVKLK